MSTLPMQPGLYRTASGSQEYLGAWHTDHWEFHYLNTVGHWCDIGWGSPYPWQQLDRAVTWRKSPDLGSTGGQL